MSKIDTLLHNLEESLSWTLSCKIGNIYDVGLNLWNFDDMTSTEVWNLWLNKYGSFNMI